MKYVCNIVDENGDMCYARFDSAREYVNHVKSEHETDKIKYFPTKKE